MCITQMNCWKLELGLEISLSLSGLLTTLELQRGCNWHANTFLHCPNCIHSQYRIPFSLLDSCEMFSYKTSSVVLCRWAAQHEKRGCSLSVAENCFPGQIPTVLPHLYPSPCDLHVSLCSKAQGEGRGEAPVHAPSQSPGAPALHGQRSHGLD